MNRGDFKPVLNAGTIAIRGGKSGVTRTLAVVAVGAVLAAVFGCHPPATPEPTLWPLCAELKRHQVIDLTHSFDEKSPHWPGFGPLIAKDIYTHDRDGFWAQEFQHVGQLGTHVDPPAHFHKGLRTVSEIPVDEMILPLVVIDVDAQVAADPDYVLKVEDVNRWEALHGPVPHGAFVAMRTDWSKRWPDGEALQNRDASGVAHYPGWSLEAPSYLYGTRGITASGHETTDTDPGSSTSRGIYACESYILGRDHYQIELLTNLDKVPQAGAIALITFPKPAGGSGFPARVVAIIPARQDSSRAKS